MKLTYSCIFYLDTPSQSNLTPMTQHSNSVKQRILLDIVIKPMKSHSHTHKINKTLVCLHKAPVYVMFSVIRQMYIQDSL